jgi:hypothetical protein
MIDPKIQPVEFIQKSVVYRLPIVGGFFIVLEDYCGREFMFALARHTYKSLGEAITEARNFAGNEVPVDLTIHFYSNENWTKVASFEYIGRDDNNQPEVKTC